MNFLKIIYKHQRGYDKPMATGNLLFDRIVGGISAGVTIIAAEPKVGKTQLMDALWILHLYENNPKQKIVWLYYSFEVSKEDKIAKFLSYFIHKEYGELLDPDYILGKLLNDENEIVPIEPCHRTLIDAMYYKHIVPLFGGANEQGEEVEGMIHFFEYEENPTGIRNNKS